ncbi:MAG: hypothetical protein ACKO5L_01300 [Bacteroidota bacterium]
MKNNTPHYIWHVDAKINSLQLLRITLTDRTTRLDLGYQANDKFYSGWWINIYQETHLRSSASDRKFIMQDQKHIVTAPNRMHYDSRADWQFFSLFFAPLPMVEQHISMIESEKPDKNNFNFYEIPLLVNDSILLKLD